MFWLFSLAAAVSLRGQIAARRRASRASGHTPAVVLSVPNTNITLPVKALGDVPADATAIRSWTFLKESLSHIGTNAVDILHVQDDLHHMQTDVRTQEQLWRKGKAHLLEERQELLRSIRALEEDIEKRKGAKVAAVGWKERADMAEGGLLRWRRENEVAVANEQQQERIGLKDALDLEEQLKKAENNEMADVVEFQAKEGALNRAIAEIIARRHELELTMQKHNASVAADVQQFNDRVLAVNNTAWELNNRMNELQTILEDASKMPDITTQEQRLKVATEALIAVQNEHQDEQVKCSARLATVTSVAASEEQKVKRRRQEVDSFCQPISAQNQILSRLLEECRRR